MGRATTSAATVAVVLAALVASACNTQSVRRFSVDKPVLWHDTDAQPFKPMPQEYWSGLVWDGADQILFVPMSEYLSIDVRGEAVNVNAMDEVPNSSWWENRIGVREMSPEELARGSCRGPGIDPAGPWVVKGAKPNGANPGFQIKAADGRSYLLKFDGIHQHSRATTADTLGSRLWYAAGFHAPCNEVLFFDRKILSIDPDARSEDAEGNKIPMTEADLDKIFAKALRLDDGRYRASASLFLAGRPLGPFTYQSKRSDDPNDVIDHQDRRELRGNRVISAWMNHFDAREQNTLDMWVKTGEDGSGFVRHHMIDFGDCLGSMWPFDGISRRLGPSGYFNVEHVIVDLFTLGMIQRPWELLELGPTGAIYGYFESKQFSPEDWEAGYPNPSFRRMTERDAAWMARIIANIGEPELRAMLDVTKIDDRKLYDYLIETLMARREKILERWLSKLSPLRWPRVARTDDGHAELCANDAGLRARIFNPTRRRYHAVVYRPDGTEVETIEIKRSGADDVCVKLPKSDSGVEPYAIVDFTAYLYKDLYAREDVPPDVYPTRFHVYLGKAARVIGIERPEDRHPPRW